VANKVRRRLGVFVLALDQDGSGGVRWLSVTVNPAKDRELISISGKEKSYLAVVDQDGGSQSCKTARALCDFVEKSDVLVKSPFPAVPDFKQDIEELIVLSPK
jgi:hypothetical protein